MALLCGLGLRLVGNLRGRRDWVEPISFPVDGLDMVLVGAELLADAANMRIDHPVGDEGVDTPNII